MPSQESETLLSVYGQWVKIIASSDATNGLKVFRHLLEHWGDLTEEPRSVDYIEENCNGIPAMWCHPKGASRDHVLLCTHGGGYIAGSMYSHRKMFGHFAKNIGCSALVVDYRMAPEHLVPTAIEDCLTAYRWLLDSGVKPRNILAVGDSAGGALAVVTQLLAREVGLTLPAGSMLMSPWVDLEGTGQSARANAQKDRLVDGAMIKVNSGVYLGEDGDRRQPLASPIYADLSGFGPIYIQVGGDEVLLDDSTRLHDRALACGVESRIDVFPEMQHIFHIMAGYAPEADEGIALFASWGKALIGLSAAG